MTTAGDEDPDQTLEKLVRLSEEAEARVLRAELMAFMRSPEVRTEFESIVRMPLESMVAAALSDEKLHAALKKYLLDALKPDIVSAAQAAASEAFRHVRVSVDPADQQRLKADVDATVKKAIADAQNAVTQTLDTAVRRACGTLRQQIENEAKQALSNPMALMPRDWSRGIGNLIQTAASEAIESAHRKAVQALSRETDSVSPDRTPSKSPQEAAAWSFPPPPMSPRGHVAALFGSMWVKAAGATILTAALAFSGFRILAPNVPDKKMPQAKEAEPSIDPLPVPTESRNLVPLQRYLDALTSVGVAAPTKDQLRVIKQACAAVKPTRQEFDVATMNAVLLNYPELQVQPTDPSSIVAVVQVALNEFGGPRGCKDLRAVTVNGLAGAGTVVALKKYATCSGQGPPLPLVTLADYVAAGIYLVEKRHEQSPESAHR